LEAAFGPGAFELISELEPPSHVNGEASEHVLSPGPGGCTLDGPLAISARDADAHELSNPNSDSRFVLFGLADENFALPVSNVVEVLRSRAVTRIPRVPEWIRGVVNLRGSIVSVLDLRRRLGMASDERYVGRRLVVARSAILQTTVGILADRVVGMVFLSGSDATEIPRALDETTACYVARWMKYDSLPVAVLNLENMLAL
jgi:purine-binding chemotaxis protein CheW